MSAFMALMSSLGVLPYFFFAKLSRPWAGLANAIASGVMLAASFGLLAEGAPYSGTYLTGGMLLGVLFVKFSQEHLEQYEVDSFEQLAGADARKVILFLAVMAVHAVGEGGGVGVSFAGDRGWAQGTLVTLAIGLHNVPEGLAVATVMAAKGTPPGRTLLWTALTALPQAVVAPIAYVFVDTFKALLPLALGFAAGCMIWIVLAELLPDALEAVEADQVATYATAAAAWLQGLSVFIAQLETPAGTLSSPFGDYAEVLPLGIMPVVLRLLPTLVVPGLAAGLLAKRCWARPLLLGLTVGLLASYSTACWVQLLLSSSQRLLCAVLLPLVGCGAAALLWGRIKKGLLALAGAAGSGGAVGLQLAGALAAAPDHIGHVLPPMALLGAVCGAACVGLLQPLLGHRVRLIGAAASLISTTPMIVAVLALLFQPGWVQQGAASAAADSVQGLSVGYNLFVLLALVLPMGKRWGPKRCSMGVACGVGCGVLLSGVLGLLCWASPYCLHVRPAGFLAGAAA
ncbi:ZIP family transporter [Scenedesmus sp. NREL 46B-D3]|nr:ZIP family transporter [Scenedesmus sp. NREL 46B-D3]